MNDPVARVVPLCDRSGLVVAEAVIDARDFFRVSLHTWHRRITPWTTYARTNVGPTTLDLHRYVMGLAFGDERQVDHIDHDGLNNRRSNLRICAPALNQQNKLSRQGASSQYRGVMWHKRSQRWRARGRLNGKLYELGSFRDEEEAAAVAAEWRRVNMPFSAEGSVAP